LQNENGINLTGRDGGPQPIDGKQQPVAARHRTLPRSAGRLAELCQQCEAAPARQAFPTFAPRDQMAGQPAAQESSICP